MVTAFLLRREIRKTKRKKRYYRYRMDIIVIKWILSLPNGYYRYLKDLIVF